MRPGGATFPCRISPTPCSRPARPTITPKVDATTLVALRISQPSSGPWSPGCVCAQRPRDEPPGQPRLVSRPTRHPAGRVGSIELLGGALVRLGECPLPGQFSRIGRGDRQGCTWPSQPSFQTGFDGSPGFSEGWREASPPLVLIFLPILEV